MKINRLYTLNVSNSVPEDSLTNKLNAVESSYIYDNALMNLESVEFKKNPLLTSSEDSQILSNQYPVKFFPLKLRNEDDEINYLKKIPFLIPFIEKMAIIPTFLVIINYIIVPLVVQATGALKFLYFYNYIFYNLWVVCCLFIVVLFRYIAKNDWSMPYLEITIQVLFFLFALSISFSTILIALQEQGSEVQDVVRRLKYVQWRHIIIYNFLMHICVRFNVLFQLRFRKIYHSYYGLPIIIICGIFVECIMFTKLDSKLGFNEINLSNYNISSRILECFYVIFFCSLACFQRFQFEVADRLKYHEMMKSVKHIKELRKKEAMKQTGNLSVIEDISLKIKNVIINLREISFDYENIEINKSIELLTECYRILTETNDLYSIHELNEDDNNVEGSMQEQFINIYANRNLKRYSTRVRFGETTGIVYDSEAVIFKFNNYNKSFNSPLKSNQKTYSKFMIESPFFSIRSKQLDEIGRSFSLDFLTIEKESPNLLVEVGSVLLLNHIEFINSSKKSLHLYLTRLQECYVPTPFHNSCHAATTAHIVMCLINCFDLYQNSRISSTDIIAVIVACLGHCVSHPGYTNSFLVNSKDPLATLYNDYQILQNSHATILFFCMRYPEANIFSGLNTENFRSFRKSIIDLILSLDALSQQELIYKFRMRSNSKAFNMLEHVEDIWLLLRLCAGFGCQINCFSEWSQHLEWTYRLYSEFYNQEVHEFEYSLDHVVFTKMNTYSQLATWRIKTMETMAYPLIQQLLCVDKSGFLESECLNNFLKNKSHWEDLEKNTDVITIDKNIKSLKADPLTPLRTLINLFITHYQSNPQEL